VEQIRLPSTSSLQIAARSIQTARVATALISFASIYPSAFFVRPPETASRSTGADTRLIISCKESGRGALRPDYYAPKKLRHSILKPIIATNNEKTKCAIEDRKINLTQSQPTSDAPTERGRAYLTFYGG
jgi:hypothetical protein